MNILDAKGHKKYTDCENNVHKKCEYLMRGQRYELLQLIMQEKMCKPSFKDGTIKRSRLGLKNNKANILFKAFSIYHIYGRFVLQSIHSSKN